MISEEKEFCCYPHNPKKSENHWRNPIYLISHTMWKPRLRDRVSQHPLGRQQPPAPDSHSAHGLVLSLSAGLDSSERSSPHFLADPREGVGSPQAWNHSTSPHLLPIFAGMGQSSMRFFFLGQGISTKLTDANLQWWCMPVIPEH